MMISQGHNCNSQQHSKAKVDNSTYLGTTSFATTSFISAYILHTP